jgi:hypothetical protein
MPMNFPDTPANGSSYTSGGVVWSWNGIAWNPTSTPGGAGISNVFIADAAPFPAVNGNLWWNSTPGDGQLYVFYNDGSSSQWIVTSNLGAGLYLPLTGGTITPGPLVINANVAAPIATGSGSLLQLSGVDGSVPALFIDAFGTSVQPTVVRRLARGTAAAPTAVQSGDVIGASVFWGYDGTGFKFGGQTYFQPAENWSATAHGTTFTIATITPGTINIAYPLTVGQGLTLNGPTGGDKGLGTINVAALAGYHVNGVSLVNGLYASTQSNYTAVTNMPTGQTMMGLGNFFSITPKLTGRVLIILTTSISWNSAAMTGSIQNMYYGTGTPPASKSAVTGAFVSLTYQATSAGTGGGSQQEPMTVSAVLTGLTPNTTYWVDLSWNSATAGANIFSSNMTAIEI